MPKTSGDPSVRASQPDGRSVRAERAAAARAERDRRAKRAKLRNLGAIGLVVVLVAVVAVVLATRDRGTGTTASSGVAMPAGITALGQGFTYGSGPVSITIYEDLQCPVCKSLEDTEGASIQQLIAANRASVTYVPLRLEGLDQGSGGYSTRGGNAAYCAGQQNFRAVHDILYRNQPPEGNGKGLTNAQILDYARQAGVTGDAFTQCVNNGTYDKLVASQTDHLSAQFEASGTTQWGTPAVFVDGQWIGQQWQQNTGYFLAIVAQETARKSASPSASAG